MDKEIVSTPEALDDADWIALHIELLAGIDADIAAAVRAVRYAAWDAMNAAEDAAYVAAGSPMPRLLSEILLKHGF